MNHKHIFAVFFGGAVGALARWGLLEALPTVTQWPWHVLIINISGSAALGIMVGLFTKDQNDLLFLAAGGGFCGAFTTFSSFSTFSTVMMEVSDELEDNRRLVPAIYLCLTVVAGVAAAFLGLEVGA